MSVLSSSIADINAVQNGETNYKVRNKTQSPKIICCFLSNRLQFQCENFTLKLQAVAEKTANNFSGLLFVAPGNNLSNTLATHLQL